MNDTSKLRIVELDEPIQLGDNPIIETLTIRRPVAGDLRGLSLALIQTTNTDEILKLLPRVTTPLMSPDEAAALALQDIMQIGDVITDFFLTKPQIAALQARRASLSQIE